MPLHQLNVRKASFSNKSDGPQRPQDGPRMAQDGPKRPQDGPKTAPRWPRNGVGGKRNTVLAACRAKRSQDGPKRAPKRLEDGFGTASVAHEMPFSRPAEPALSLSAATPKKVPSTGQKGQPSQRLRYNMGCGGVRGASYNPPHPSEVHGAIKL